MPDSKFKTVASLAADHARVGLNTPNDVGDVMVAALLESSGYSLKDIKQVIPAGASPRCSKMLPAGKVDAIWLPQPLGEIAEQQVGAVPLADFDQGSMQDFPFTGYIGSDRVGAVASVPRSPRSCARLARARRWPTPTGRRWSRRWRSTPASRRSSPTPCRSTATRSRWTCRELQRVPDSMFQYGLTPGVKSPYQIINMIQPEPKLIRR